MLGRTTARLGGLTVSDLALGFLAFILMGYAFMNKSFAYIGINPLFIGEICLGFCLFSLLAGTGSFRFVQSPITWAVAIVMIWGMIRTIPFVGEYGSVALRDAVIWGYALFAFVSASIILRAHAAERVMNWYASWIPFFLLVAPIFFVITQQYGATMMRMPGTDNVPIINVKGGDVGVHLGGIAAFLALGLHTVYPKKPMPLLVIKDFYLWAMLCIDVIVTGSRNRGGMVSVFAALAVVFIFRPKNRLTRVILPILAVVAVFSALDVRIPLGGGREVSTAQITENIMSIVGFGQSEQETLSGTVEWRLLWWEAIIQDTLFGDYFWGGVGYGTSLADLYGFSDATKNRSPHNGHLTYLARSGVVGFVFWLLLIVTVAVTLTRGFYKARREKNEVLANLNVFILAYGLAALTNSTFDVYLEGPQGGIWFWCLVGFGIVLNRIQSKAPAPFKGPVPTNLSMPLPQAAPTR